MFKRSFMESFKITKYARQSGQFGRISSNSSIILRNDLIIKRVGIFFISFLLLNNAFGDFEIFHELFVHLSQPFNCTNW